MRLRVVIPTRVLVSEEDVTAIVAEGEEGSFGILPRHVDYVTALVPGILTYRTRAAPGDALVAVDRGILVKHGDEVAVSVRDATLGAELADLRATVDERYRRLDEREALARSALATLEARFFRRFLEQFADD